MRKFNVKGETIELSENFNDILKDGLRNHRSGKFLDYTDNFDVAINGNHNYYGYYLGRYPSALRLMVYCKLCDSFVMTIPCNAGGELRNAYTTFYVRIFDECGKHFPNDNKGDD